MLQLKQDFPNIYKHLFCILICFFISDCHIIAKRNLFFVCKTGGVLNFDRVCDGRLDCNDGSDEIKELCYRTVCPVGQFRCHYGACVSKSMKCNGVRDCADGSDEMQCGRKLNSCAHQEFRCESGQCIQSTKICDAIDDCSDGSDESLVLCERQLCPVGTFRCTYGGCIPKEGQCDGFMDCIDGSDESLILCLAVQCPTCGEKIMCPPIKSQRIDVKCEHKRRSVSCDRPMESETKAVYSCKDYYLPINDLHSNNNEAECQKDGTWSRDILQCKPDCGHLSSAVPLVVNGWSVTQSFPWHVSIFVRQYDNTYRFWCGATLISEAIVVTAAHCVWSAKPSDIKLAFRSTKSILNDTIDEYALYFNVKQIIVHPLYLDKFGNYGSDIALLEVNETIEFSDHILPVCIDWNLDDITSHLSDQSLGFVMGMGVTENNRFSDDLRVTSLPVVANTKCLQRERADFRKFLTFTTFCAGWENGTGVCNGDSGGGLVFPQQRGESIERWSLQGVVSLSPRRPSTSFCDPTQYTIFTKVGIYVKWIENVLKSIHSMHEYDEDTHTLLFG